MPQDKPEVLVLLEDSTNEKIMALANNNWVIECPKDDPSLFEDGCRDLLFNNQAFKHSKEYAGFSQNDNKKSKSLFDDFVIRVLGIDDTKALAESYSQRIFLDFYAAIYSSLTNAMKNKNVENEKKPFNVLVEKSMGITTYPKDQNIYFTLTMSEFKFKVTLENKSSLYDIPGQITVNLIMQPGGFKVTKLNCDAWLLRILLQDEFNFFHAESQKNIRKNIRDDWENYRDFLLDINKKYRRLLEKPLWKIKEKPAITSKGRIETPGEMVTTASALMMDYFAPNADYAAINGDLEKMGLTKAEIVALKQSALDLPKSVQKNFSKYVVATKLIAILNSNDIFDDKVLERFKVEYMKYEKTIKSIAEEDGYFFKAVNPEEEQKIIRQSAEACKLIEKFTPPKEKIVPQK